MRDAILSMRAHYCSVLKKNFSCFVLFLFGFLSLATAEISASLVEHEKIYHYHRDVADHVWDAIHPYLLPHDHEIRKKLDRIFQKRAIKNMDALVERGFHRVTPQQWTRLIVTKHRELPGYIFKLYLDSQHHHRKQPDHFFWVKRCCGAEKIRTELNQHQWNHLFKVPHKWIYPLPPHPRPSTHGFPKYFILVEEEMDIYPPEWNDQLWSSPFIDKHKLDILFYIVQKHGFVDCIKPANIPVCFDGRIAFVDTQSYHSWPIRFFNLFNLLSPSMLEYWKQLIEKYPTSEVLPFSD